MSSSARCCALLLSLLAGPALGQANGVVPRHSLPAAERRTPPDWIPAGDLHPAPIDLVAAMNVGDGMQLGIGRFSMLDLARSRTNMEREPRPTNMARRERSIAAVRLSFSF